MEMAKYSTNKNTYFPDEHIFVTRDREVEQMYTINIILMRLEMFTYSYQVEGSGYFRKNYRVEDEKQLITKGFQFPVTEIDSEFNHKTAPTVKFSNEFINCEIAYRIDVIFIGEPHKDKQTIPIRILQLEEIIPPLQERIPFDITLFPYSFLCREGNPLTIKTILNGKQFSVGNEILVNFSAQGQNINRIVRVAVSLCIELMGDQQQYKQSFIALPRIILQEESEIILRTENNEKKGEKTIKINPPPNFEIPNLVFTLDRIQILHIVVITIEFQNSIFCQGNCDIILPIEIIPQQEQRQGQQTQYQEQKNEYLITKATKLKPEARVAQTKQIIHL